MRKVDLKSGDKVTVLQKGEPVTPMPEPIEIPAGLSHMGEPNKVWIYRRPDGSAYGAVARWDGAEGKQIRPIIWNGTTFVSGGFGDNRPLLNSEMAASLPMAPILIVEGEKTLDAAAQYAPEGWVVVTWCGGANAWDKSDWSLLKGHPCVVWPDNDEPGLRAADGIRIELSRLKIKSAAVAMSPKFPAGWDLADPLPVGRPELMTQLMRATLKDVALLEVEEEKPPAPEPSEHEDVDLRYRALGYDHDVYYIMSHHKKQMDAYKTGMIMSEKGLMDIVPDRGYWTLHYGDERGRVNWIDVGSKLMLECTNAGRYNASKIRERGVWIDEGRVILNSGAQMFVDGKEVNHAKLRSKYIYPCGPDLLEEWVNLEEPAPDNYGALIRDVCSKVRWSSPIYADLLAGWIATAGVCGALPWRTHCWITGNQGSGKTTVVNMIAGACIGDMALYPVGASTEAGIRQAVGNDAIPVVFDESEDTKNKEERREAVIQLMRQSSSESRGRIMKGSANHTAVSFTLRSSFLMSSIGVGLREAADLTRTAVLTVRPKNAVTISEREEQERQWKEFMVACLKVPDDAPHRLLARQVNNLMTLRANIKTFKEVISVNVKEGDGRLGDQLGTLLAGNYSLIRNTEISSALCEKYLEKYNWDEFTSSKVQREDLTLLYYLAGKMLRVEASHGTVTRLVGELIEISMQVAADNKVDHALATETLLRYGIKVDREFDGIWIGTGIDTLKDLMKGSDYGGGWQRVLERHPNISKSDNAIKFKGTTSRALFVPRREIANLEG